MEPRDLLEVPAKKAKQVVRDQWGHLVLLVKLDPEEREDVKVRLDHLVSEELMEFLDPLVSRVLVESLVPRASLVSLEPRETWERLDRKEVLVCRDLEVSKPHKHS